MKLHKNTQKYFWNSSDFLPVMGTGAAGSVQNNSTWVGVPTPQYPAGNDPLVPPGALQKLLNDHITFWILRQSNLQCMNIVKYAPACMRSKFFQSVGLFVTLWAVGHQVPLSMGFSRQE